MDGPALSPGEEDEGLRILSLDGGDVCCVSELKILDEFMQRVQYDTGKTLRPCDYFHSITGVGASGVVAILLGVLGMTIEEANGAFLQLCKQVFPAEEITPKMRSQLLIVATAQLLDDFGVPKESKLRGDLSKATGCKVSVAYMSAVDMTNCRMLRSYESRHSTYNPTIIEAISIAWATPGLFPSIRAGSELIFEELVSGVDGFNNPAFQAVKEAYEIFGSNKRMGCLLSLGAGKPLLRSASIDRQDLLQRAVRDTEVTVEQMRRRYAGLRIYFRLSVDRDLSFGNASSPFEKRLGRIVSLTSTYLETHDAFTIMDRCVKSSLKASRVTIDHLYHTRASGARSSHGLPPLSAFFVVRDQPMEDIINALQNGPHDGQRVAVVVGMSGSGKTQISLRYGYDFDDVYDHILFVDASSAESLQNGILTRVRGLDRSLNPLTPMEAIDLLAQPEGNISRNWLIIMDNADSLEFDIREFFPECDHGAILITSRNPTLGNLSAEGPIYLDVMSRDEAMELLLATALGPSLHHANSDRLSKALGSEKRPPEYNRAAVAQRSAVRYTEDDRRYAAETVELLGFLPVAIVQAGCYIRMQKCFPDYANRLRTNRARVLRKPALAQRDRLKYEHSVYAAFDTTLNVLSPAALQLLSILSFVHFMDFPRPLFAVAASSGFQYEPQYLLERGSDYQKSVDLLKAVLCPSGQWDEEVVDEILEELQQYSMVTLVPIYSTVTLRFHPLLHAWAKDRLSVEEAASFRAAAIRLLACGTNPDDDYLWEYLLPHFKYISPFADDLHVNDRGALAAVVRQLMDPSELLRIWEDLYSQVKKVHGENHIQTSQAALELADAYGSNGQEDRMEQMERDVVKVRVALLGEDHPSSLYATSNLARTLRGKNEYNAAAELEIDVLDRIRKAENPDRRNLAQALRDLAMTRRAQGQYNEAITLVNEALEATISLIGKAHPATIVVMEQLASCYGDQGNVDRVEQLEKEIHALKKQLFGNRHAKTLDAITSLATSYAAQEKYAEAEANWREVLEGRRETSGNYHSLTLNALHRLGMALFDQKGHYAEAEVLWEEEVQLRREAHGSTDEQTLEAIHWNARAIFEQERHAEAEILWREEVRGRRFVHGNEHGETLSAIHWLARSIYAQSRSAEAQVLWEEDVKGRINAYGANATTTLNAIGWLSSCCYEQKNYERAEELRKQQLEGRRAVQGRLNDETMGSLFWMARIAFERERYAEAEALWMEELQDRLEFHGPIHTDTLDSSHWIGRCRMSQDNFAGAEIIWRETLEGHRKLSGNFHADTLNAMGWLSNALVALEKYHEAEELRVEQVKGRKQLYGGVNDDTLGSMFMLAKAIYEQKEYSRARKVWEEELVGRRQLHGNDHKDTLDAMYWIARCYFEDGSYADSEPVWREELGGRRRVNGDFDSDSLDALHWLGRAVHAQERFEESEALWREEVTGRQKTFGNKDTSTLNSTGWVAAALFKQSRYAESETFRREQWVGRQKALGKTHDETLTALFWLARCCYEQKKYAECRSLWREEIEKRAEIDGKPNKDKLDASFWLARSFFDENEYQEAEKIWREELAGRRELKGEYDSDTLDALHWLARSIHAQGRYEESGTLWTQDLAARKKTFGDCGPSTLNAMGWLSATLFEQKKYPEAEEIRREQLKLRREVFGNLDSNTMNAMFSLAMVAFKQDRYEEAEKQWREELEYRRQVHGNHHTDTLDAMHWLGRALYEQEKYDEPAELWKEEIDGRKEVEGPEHSDTLRAIEWLEKLDAKQRENAVLDGPSPNVEDHNASPESAHNHQAQADDAPLSSPPPAAQASTAPQTPQISPVLQIPSPPRVPSPSPWLQRLQQSGKNRLDQISRVFP